MDTLCHYNLWRTVPLELGFGCREPQGFGSQDQYLTSVRERSLICDSRDAIRDISLVNSLSEPLSKPRQPLRPGSTLRRCHDVLK
ncbi:unnamed protein product, partial [Cyprideis torosa]